MSYMELLISCAFVCKDSLKLVVYGGFELFLIMLLYLWQRVSGESESSSETSKSEADESADKSKQLLKKGN